MKFDLQIRCALEAVDKLYVSEESFEWNLRLKCSSCGEESPKWHPISSTNATGLAHARCTTNFQYKCKLCARENRLDIENIAQLSADELNSFTTVATLDCKGVEPVGFAPGQGWVAVAAESGTVFRDVDLSANEWYDYDEGKQRCVSVSDFESRFVRRK